MNNDYFRYYKANFLIGFILITGTLIQFITNWLFPIINSEFDKPYLQYPSTTILLGFLFILIDKFWWNKKPFSFMFWHKDISGTYEGEIKFRNPVNKQEETKTCRLVITQTGSNVSVKASFEKKNGQEQTQSKSLVTSIVNAGIDCHELVFTYINDGNALSKFPPSYGTNILKINPKEKTLDGVYYTNRKPHQTEGIMKVSQKIKN